MLSCCVCSTRRRCIGSCTSSSVVARAPCSSSSSVAPSISSCRALSNATSGRSARAVRSWAPRRPGPEPANARNLWSTWASAGRDGEESSCKPPAFGVAWRAALPWRVPSESLARGYAAAFEAQHPAPRFHRAAERPNLEVLQNPLSRCRRSHSLQRCRRPWHRGSKHLLPPSPPPRTVCPRFAPHRSDAQFLLRRHEGATIGWRKKLDPKLHPPTLHSLLRCVCHEEAPRWWCKSCIQTHLPEQWQSRSPLERRAPKTWSRQTDISPNKPQTWTKLCPPQLGRRGLGLMLNSQPLIPQAATALPSHSNACLVLRRPWATGAQNVSRSFSTASKGVRHTVTMEPLASTAPHLGDVDVVGCSPPRCVRRGRSKHHVDPILHSQPGRITHCSRLAAQTNAGCNTSSQATSQPG